MSSTPRPARRSTTPLLAGILLLSAALWPTPGGAGGGSVAGEWRGLLQPNQCSDGNWTGDQLDFCLSISQDDEGLIVGKLDWWEFEACELHDFSGLKHDDKLNLKSESGFGLSLSFQGGQLTGQAMWGDCPPWPLQLSRVRAAPRGRSPASGQKRL